MIDGTSTNSRFAFLFFAIAVFGVNVYSFVKDVRQSMVITGIFFAISFVILLLLYLQELKNKKAFLDDNGNIGEEVVAKTLLGKELYNATKNGKNSRSSFGLHNRAYEDLLQSDIDKLTSIYGIISDLNAFKNAVEKVDKETNFRNILALKHSQISNHKFRSGYNESVRRYPKLKPNAIDKEKIEMGYDKRTGYCVKDEFRELKIKNENSTLFNGIAKKIVLETLDSDISAELTAE